MLLAVMGSTLVLGLLPGLRGILVLHVLTDVLFAGYVFLLVQARNADAERQMRTHFAALRVDIDAADDFLGDGLRQRAIR